MKPPVFIGSSSESLQYVKWIKAELEEKLAITVWQANFFEMGSVTYDTLYKKAICFKYAIFVGGKDDEVFRTSKGEESFKPRDNVYYELGLFAGILSPQRTYFVVHEDVQIASDFAGVTCKRFKNREDIQKICEEILKQITEEERKSVLTLVPSVTQAVAYFENYVRPVCKGLFMEHTVQIGQETFDIDFNKSSLKIVFPSNINADWHDFALTYYKNHKYSAVNILGEYRVFDVYAKKDRIPTERVFEGCMAVDAMKVVYEVIHRILGSFGGLTEEEKMARLKEASIFFTTLKNQIEIDEYAKDFVKMEEPEWL